MKILSTRARAARQARMQELIDDALLIYKTPATYNPEALQEDFYFVSTEQAIDQEQEYLRCMKDPMYFISTYLRVDNCFEGSSPIQEVVHQAQVVNGLEESRRIIVKHPRQAGMTTISLAYALWKAMFHFDQTILFATPTHAQACEARFKFRRMYEALPTWLRAAVRIDRTNQLNFVNNSIVRFTACTESLSRGMSPDLLVLDGFAQVRPEIAECVWYMVIPCIHHRSQFLVSATPNKRDDLFAQIWAVAEAGRSFLHAINISYWQLPHASVESAEKLKLMMGEAAFRRDFLAEFV